MAKTDVIVRVADRNRKILAYVDCEVGPVSWRRNDVGKASIRVAKTDPKATATNFQFGNHAILQFSNNLPDWAGVMQPPLRWTRDSITMFLDSGEAILGWRQTDQGRYFESVTVGYIYKALINEANAVSDMGIVLSDNVWTGGNSHSPDYHFKDILQICKESLTSRLEECDFYLTPSVDENTGYITYTAELDQSRGSDKSSSVLLEEGHNLAPIGLEQQGPLWNSWDIVGEGADWGEERLKAHAESASSISTYGLRQNSSVYSDVKTQATLDSIADNLVADQATPHNLWTLEAINKEPALFSSYDVGDTVTLLSHSFGFGGTNTTIRILTREYLPQTDTCRLIVRET